MAITTMPTRHKCGKFKKILKDGKVIGFLKQLNTGWIVGGEISKGQYSNYVGAVHTDALGLYSTEFDAIKAWCIANKICYPKE